MRINVNENFKDINPTNTTSSLLVEQANTCDFLAKLSNSLMSKNIESFYRTLSTSELELFKYLCYYYRKWEGRIKISIKNMCDRFKLRERRVHYILSSLNTLGIIVSIKKGHTGSATLRTITERGMILWKALKHGFKSIKQDIPKKSADSCADSPGVHTNYISSKVDISFKEVIFDKEKEKEIDEQIAKIDPIKKKSFIEMLKQANKT